MPIRTIAGRWRQNAAVSGLDKLPQRDRALCMTMFYAGFAAALEAMNEIGELPEEQAFRVLQALHAEVQQVQAAAVASLGAGSH